MPTLLIIDGFRFFFYSNDHDPPHVHVEKAGATAKFDIHPAVKLVKSSGFSAKDLKRCKKIIEENTKPFIEKWNKHFNR